MNKRVVFLMAAALGVFLLGISLPAAADAAEGTWELVPLNPDYLDYLADQAAGNEVPPHTPLMLYIDPNFVTVPGPPATLGPMPSAYDLRDLGRVTPAWGTGKNCGMCWTSAAMGSLESFLAPGELRDFSEAHMQITSFEGLEGATCFLGANPKVATQYLAAWRGPVNETDFSPNAGRSKPLSAIPRPAVQKHVQKVMWLPDRKGPLDNTWIKLAVMFLGGTYSMISKSGWGINDQLNTWYDPTPGVNHAVTIVGWDDNFDRNKFFFGDPKNTGVPKIPLGNGAFIAKDNAGPGAWEKGFFYVSYYDATLVPCNIAIFV